MTSMLIVVLGVHRGCCSYKARTISRHHSCLRTQTWGSIRRQKGKHSEPSWMDIKQRAVSIHDRDCARHMAKILRRSPP